MSMDRNPMRIRAGIVRIVLIIGIGFVALTAAAHQAPLLLREGDTGAGVEALQRRLNARLDPSPALDIDGDFGPATRDALIRFQRQAKLRASGVTDAATWTALGPAPPPAPEPPAPAIVNAEIPKKQPADAIDGPPFVSARAWAIAEGGTGRLLQGSEAERPLPIASTTKMMTALVVLREAAKDPEALDETVTFSENADRTPGSTSGVRAGESLPVRELLYGLLLPSGNDAAVALAEHFGGRLPALDDDPDAKGPLPRFVAEMNRLAGILELKEAHFANPHGLPAAGHEASARDLARLAAMAMKNANFARIVATSRHGCTLSDAQGKTRNVVWNNTNRLLAIEGYDGVKTGTTSAAGNCLVASARRDGRHLIVVILGAGTTEGRYIDARNLFRWAWQSASTTRN